MGGKSCCQARQITEAGLCLSGVGILTVQAGQTVTGNHAMLDLDQSKQQEIGLLEPDGYNLMK